MSVDLRIDGEDFSVLYKQIKAIDGELAKATRKRLTDSAVEARDAVRAAALAIDSKGGSVSDFRKRKGVGRGLRQGIAAATEIKIEPARPKGFSVRIRVSGTKFKAATGKPVTLPRYMEGLSKRGEWRHPVFVKRADLPGKREWARQDAQPYLIRTVIEFRPKVRAAVYRAMDEAVDAAIANNS